MQNVEDFLHFNFAYLKKIPVIINGVMVKELDCDLKVSEFEFQSRYYLHFKTNPIYQPLRSGRIWHKVNF